jgi:hypothetical protein
MSIHYSSAPVVPSLQNVAASGPQMQSIPQMRLAQIGDVQYIGNLSYAQVLVWNGRYWQNSEIGSMLSLQDLNDVEVDDETVTEGDVLTWNGTSWVNMPVSINDLGGVTITDPVIYDFLSYDGTEWINAQAQLGMLSDVDINDPVAGQVLSYTVHEGPGPGFTGWQNTNLGGSPGDVAGWNSSSQLGPIGLGYQTAPDNEGFGLFTPFTAGPPFVTLGDGDIYVGQPSVTVTYASTGQGVVIGSNTIASAVGNSVLIGANASDSGQVFQTVVGAAASSPTPGAIVLGNSVTGVQSNTALTLGVNSDSVNTAYGNGENAAPGLMYMNVELLVGSDNPSAGANYQYYLPLVGPVGNFSDSPLVTWPSMITQVQGEGGTLPTSTLVTLGWLTITGRNDMAWAVGGSGNNTVTTNNNGWYDVDFTFNIQTDVTDTWTFAIFNFINVTQAVTYPLGLVPRGSNAVLALSGQSVQSYSVRRLLQWNTSTSFQIACALDGVSGATQPGGWLTLSAQYRGP